MAAARELSLDIAVVAVFFCLIEAFLGAKELSFSKHGGLRSH